MPLLPLCGFSLVLGGPTCQSAVDTSTRSTRNNYGLRYTCVEWQGLHDLNSWTPCQSCRLLDDSYHYNGSTWQLLDPTDSSLVKDQCMLGLHHV